MNPSNQYKDLINAVRLLLIVIMLLFLFTLALLAYIAIDPRPIDEEAIPLSAPLSV